MTVGDTTRHPSAVDCSRGIFDEEKPILVKREKLSNVVAGSLSDPIGPAG
ncbi:hypothetical protein [Mesorhizobium captivum]|nr:hypothetical protein [Mesorhizobium sp. VK3C]MDX8444380.1 hypothetical protein [Mesorhizobium sp. VK3C]